MPYFLRQYVLASSTPIPGQGYVPLTDSNYGSTAAYQTLRKLYKASKSYRKTFPQLARRVGCTGTSAVCGAGVKAADANEYAALMIATSPARYDARDPSMSGSKRVISPVRDQGTCSSCSAFAVIAAAETAVASFSGVDASKIDLSEQHAFYCSGSMNSLCSRGLSFAAPLKALEDQNLMLESCLPYKPDIRDELTGKDICRSLPPCKPGLGTAAAVAFDGTFSSRPVGSAELAQRATRRYGGVITRFDVYSGFREFLRRTKGREVYKPSSTETAKTVEERHSVLLVGYDNNGGYWIAKNSWGSGEYGDGFFKVQLGPCIFGQV